MTAVETDLWVPTVNQIVMASQRAILAALDTNLLLAQRTLQAEHADDLSNENPDEPSPPHLALTQYFHDERLTEKWLISPEKWCSRPSSCLSAHEALN